MKNPQGLLQQNWRPTNGERQKWYYFLSIGEATLMLILERNKIVSSRGHNAPILITRIMGTLTPKVPS